MSHDYLTGSTLYQIYKRDPLAALDEAFRREEARHGSCWNKCIFVWQSLLGVDGKVTYGSYKNISRKDLEGRKFRVEFWDHNVSIYWLDVLHDPRTYQRIPIGEVK